MKKKSLRLSINILKQVNENVNICYLIIVENNSYVLCDKKYFNISKLMDYLGILK